MRILYIITGLGLGGAETLLADLCSSLTGTTGSLAGTADSFTGTTGSLAGTADSFTGENNFITVVYLTSLDKLAGRLEEMGVRVIPLCGGGPVRKLLALRRLIRAGQYDIVHTHLPLADTIGRAAALLAGGCAPILSTVHGLDDWKESKRLSYRLLRVYNRLTVNRLRRVSLVAVSESVKHYCIALERIRPEKITVIYNFLDYANPVKTDPSFVPARTPGTFLAVTVGRLAEQKGQMVLVRAMDELVNRRGIRTLRVQMVGDGPMRGTLEAAVAECGLEAYITLCGFRTNTFDYIRQADLFVYPSEREGFGIAALEAFYCGTPVLTAATEAARELLRDGTDSIFFAVNDPADLADKLCGILSGHFDLSSLVTRGRARCADFSLERHRSELLALYAGLQNIPG